jgi:hypothetical protein
MLRPCSDEALTIWPVGKAVGNVKNTGPRLLMPVEAARKPDHIHAMLVSLETLWGSEKTKMTTDPKRKTLQDKSGRDKRRQQEEALDEALKNTFPASDPISAEQPGRDPRGSED